MVDSDATAWIDSIRDRASEMKYSPGDALFFQGETSDRVGYILTGHAKAIAYSHDGEETWLGRFNAQDFIGHTDFLTKSDVAFEVTAETEMSVLMFPSALIAEQFESNAHLSQVFARDLAARVQTMMQRLLEALTLSAKGRVCAELLRLSGPVGLDPDKLVVRPNPVFVDLALRINSSRETVSRTISELQKRGVLSREAGAVLIHNPSALRAAMR